MNRIELARQAVQALAPADLFEHLEGVALASAELARRRGLDAELAEIAGYWHDMARAKEPWPKHHGPKGAELAKVWMTEQAIFSSEEIDAVYQAIYHHSKKRLIHSPFDEVLKDGDVYDHVINGLFLEKDQERIAALQQELR